MTDRIARICLSWPLFAFAYVAGVGSVGLSLYWHLNAAWAPVAKHHLRPHHRIERTDLQLPDRVVTPLVGRYLRREIAMDEPVTEADFDPNPVLGGLAGSLAAVIRVPKTTIDILKLDVDVETQICRGGHPLGPPLKVAALECDDGSCAVALKLPPQSPAAPAITTEDLAVAVLAAAATPPACPPPAASSPSSAQP